VIIIEGFVLLIGEAGFSALTALTAGESETCRRVGVTLLSCCWARGLIFLLRGYGSETCRHGVLDVAHQISGT